jgi:alkanesulfonate monooxygenase SsuD/methylene tetrahydromethanopterin reductase-like flavin-dependent oxidoreductase (luciferase family)
VVTNLTLLVLIMDVKSFACLAGTPTELVAQLRALEQQGLNQVRVYPPLNRQYRVIEDFAEQVLSRM